MVFKMTSEVLQTLVLIFSIIGGSVSLILGVIMHKKLALSIGAVFLIIVGFIVIIGYLVGVPTIYTVPVNGIGMALPTGICFLITGCILLLLINEIDFKK